MFDLLVIAAFFVTLLILSFVLLRGKGGFLIAGFNLLPKEQKEKIDCPGLCRFMGKISLGLACSTALILAYIITEIAILNTLGLALLAVLVIIALVWSTVRYAAPLRK